MSVTPLMTIAGASSAVLVKLENGEYTAPSVAADPTEAAKLNLVKENDGNYGTTPPAPIGVAAVAHTSPVVLASLTSLNLGGE